MGRCPDAQRTHVTTSNDSSLCRSVQKQEGGRGNPHQGGPRKHGVGLPGEGLVYVGCEPQTQGPLHLPPRAHQPLKFPVSSCSKPDRGPLCDSSGWNVGVLTSTSRSPLTPHPGGTGKDSN